MTYRTATEAWLILLNQVQRDGLPVGTANHGQSVEIINNRLYFNMRYPVVTAMARNLNYRYPIAEAHLTILGANRLDFSESVAKTLHPWSDDKVFINGAYGPKFVDQLPYVTQLLRKKPASRQAIISLWRDSPRESLDVPCTVTMHFLIREDKLHCIVYMRSSDSYLGLPNDMLVFTMLATEVLMELRLGLSNSKLELGTMHINLGSSHIYTKDNEKVSMILEDPKISSTTPFEPYTWSWPGFIAFLASVSKMTKENAQLAVFNWRV